MSQMETSIENICLIGATGFVGRHLVGELAQRGKRTIVLARKPGKADMPDAEIVQLTHNFDFSGIDAVINLAGVLHGPFDEAHVDLPRNIALACADQNVPRLLHMSALGASVNGPSEYLKSKMMGEEEVRKACQGSRTHYTIFRPSVIAGRDDHFVTLFSKLLRKSPVLPLACPNSLLQPILVEDVARAFADSLCMSSAFDETFCLCGPQSYTLAELVRLMAQGRKRLIIPLSDRISYLQARLLEFTPGPLMTRDNYLSLSKDNVCEVDFPFDWKPGNIEKLFTSAAPQSRAL